jgi:hydroxymethylbilane synthase
MIVVVGARSSPLSRAQVQEVLEELRKHHPEVDFENIYLETQGDKDRSISLRTLGKTDFFTRELDQLLLQGGCRVAIHSAKDLPDPLPAGSVLAGLTEGIDPADVLVMRDGESLDSLPSGARIATSSQRREDQVKLLRADLLFCDVRGTIAERLALLQQGAADGVVLAEAALIRLGWTHLNRIRLPAETVPFQGQLAILCREDDAQMRELFKCLDSRQKKYKVLYLGIDLPEKTEKNQVYIHYPIIRIQVRPSTYQDIQEGFKNLNAYTHFLFTSKSAVHAFFRQFSHFGYKTYHLHGKEMLCVGQQTARALQAYGIPNPLVSPTETAEGMMTFLDSLTLINPYFFWPHSALSRPVISDHLKQKELPFRECILYDTEVNRSLLPFDLKPIDEIYFTSPSTIDAFIELFGSLPKDKVIKTIGPITENALALDTKTQRT